MPGVCLLLLPWQGSSAFLYGAWLLRQYWDPALLLLQCLAGSAPASSGLGQSELLSHCRRYATDLSRVGRFLNDEAASKLLHLVLRKRRGPLTPADCLGRRDESVCDHVWRLCSASEPVRRLTRRQAGHGRVYAILRTDPGIFGCGQPISPSTQPGRAFSTSPSCSMRSAGASPGDRWLHSPRQGVLDALNMGW